MLCSCFDCSSLTCRLSLQRMALSPPCRVQFLVTCRLLSSHSVKCFLSMKVQLFCLSTCYQKLRRRPNLIKVWVVFDTAAQNLFNKWSSWWARSRLHPKYISKWKWARISINVCYWKVGHLGEHLVLFSSSVATAIYQNSLQSWLSGKSDHLIFIPVTVNSRPIFPFWSIVLKLSTCKVE